MANFFRQNPDDDLTKLNLGVGQTVTVGLYGGGPAPDYNDLYVRSSSGCVKCTENKAAAKGNNRYFTLTGAATGKADIVGTLSEGGSDYYTASINVTVGTVWGSEKTRKGIVDAGRKWVGTAHYLWGSAGNTPDVPDSIVYGKKVAAKMLDNDDVKQLGAKLTATLGEPVKSGLDPKTPLIAVAYTLVGKTQDLFLCAGGVSGKASSAASSQEINDVLKGMKDIDSPIGGKSPTPRKYKTGTIVMGDNCNNKKHFDCVGLVNYCVGLHLKNPLLVPLEIFQWMNAPDNSDDKKIAGTAGMTAVMDPKDPCMNGDIVGQYNGQWHHIGMVFLDGNTAKILQAVDTPNGLSQHDTYNPTSPGAWTRRVRVHDSLLV